MRLISFLIAIVVLFALSDSSMAQDVPAQKAVGLRLLTWPGKAPAPTAAGAGAQGVAPGLPTSIYDPLPPKPAAHAVPALAQAAPLHTPDAETLGPQFFDGASPDLATPPPPPPRTVTTANGRVQLVAPDSPN